MVSKPRMPVFHISRVGIIPKMLYISLICTNNKELRVTSFFSNVLQKLVCVSPRNSAIYVLLYARHRLQAVEIMHLLHGQGHIHWMHN